MIEQTETGDNLAPKPADRKAVLKRCLRYLASVRPNEKRWRKRAQQCLEYYFHKQWSKDDKDTVEGRGQAAITVNRTRITINMMLGLMAAQPIDPRMKPVGKNDDALSDLGTASIKYVWDANQGEDLRLQAYFWQAVYGYAVAYTGFYVRDRDRRSEPVQALMLDPREVSRDPNCKRDDLTDCRWVDWKRKLPVEDAIDLYPDYADKLRKMAGKDEEGQSSTPYTGPIDGTIPAPSDWDKLEAWNLAEDVDRDQEMVTLHEIWERKWEKGSIIRYKDGYVEEFNPQDPAQAGLLLQMDVQAIERDVDVPRIYYHVICGNEVLESEPSPYKHGQFPFVWVTNELDHNNDPISEVEYLKDLQDEINHRRSKLLYELSNNQLVVDPSIAGHMGMTVDELAAHAKKPGAVWLGQQGQVGYLSRDAASTVQFQLMQDSKAEMQAVSGANDDLMGYDSSSDSGKAKDITRQQGMTLQKPREAKFRGFLVRLVDQMMQLIQQAWTDEKVIRLKDDVGTERLIAVNQMGIDPVTGLHRKMNDIQQSRFEVAIDFDAWTPTQQEKVGEILKDLADKEPDPIARRILLRAAIKALPIPDKAQILEAYAEVDQAMMPPPMPEGLPPDMPMEPVSPYAPQVA